MAEHEPDFKTVFPDIDAKVLETLTDGFDLWKWQYLFKTADKLGYIDDCEFTARLMVRYGIGKEVALPIYKAWKKSYMETLRAKERSKAYGNYN